MISLFHIPSSQFVASASIRNQGHRDHFYRSLAIEASLGDIEGRAAVMIRNALDREVLPQRLTKEHSELLLFVLFQHYRTPSAAASLEQLSDGLFKRLAAREDRMKEHLSEFRVRLWNAPAVSLRSAAEVYPMALDLELQLIRNRTAHPFITCDHPVVLYNQFMESRQPFASHIGVASKGLQVFMPLNPSYTLMLFDSQSYLIGGRRLRPPVVESTQPDVVQLNLLQVLNADQQLYFNDDIDEQTIRASVDCAAELRTRVRASVDELILPPKESSTPHSLIRIRRVPLRADVKLSFVGKLPQAAGQGLTPSRTNYLRNPTLCDLHDRFLQAVDRKEFKLSEFSKFRQEDLKTE